MKAFIKEYFPHFENDSATVEEVIKLEKQLEIDLPSDYKDFLIHLNGFEGEVGSNYTVFEPVSKIYELTQNFCAESFPWAIYIGSNGNLEMFVIDKRTYPRKFGLLPFIADDKDFISLGETFEQFLYRLREGTSFEN
ncbi:SMI1/KNR4 family protein [Spirosoma utsteinense]|uniref:Knr4/Smi1-like domain-containing protein n=1 Tax=Spirosoma utsteinense TaxID=2585773 RepID=A0ABR6W6E9_9BACT|nr:SMI1/KNR4 family protein [Spirosoma utsteinense]MBC3789061.1 hypothetical protein [Spirosoma utsteinense]MBC3792129.1 hypothetical protein [Spirosoma utsteinense]